MSLLDQWRHKEEWKREGNDFCVVVSRHMSQDKTEHRWAVYLYVYPGHADFERFNPEGDMWSQPHFDCHSCVSLFNVHRRKDGSIGSFQLGWDYNHDGDWQFNEMATPSDASSIFWDANQLFDQAKQEQPQ